MMLERNKKKLHRVARDHESDWDQIDAVNMNSWQRVASGSRGILTIGNGLTVIGFVAVAIGLYFIANEQFWTGLFYIGLGRMLDYFDGIAADMTKTKSRLGASFDEVADAVGLGLSMVVFLINNVMPVLLLILIALPKTLNAFSWCVSKLRKKRMDTTAQSKVATFIIWSGVLFYLLYRASDTPFSGLLVTLGWAFSAFGAVLSVPSSVAYVKNAFQK